MDIISKSIPEVKLFLLKKHHDRRGFFFETFRKSWFSDNNIHFEPLQYNVSHSSENILRGLHFQSVNPQAKFVTAIQGAILDIAVDIRPNSQTFGRYVSQELNDETPSALFIPKGFAHGFYTLSKSATITYICDNEYQPQYDRGIVWNDPCINITWPCLSPIVSDKDSQWSSLSNLNKQDLIFLK